MIRTEREIEDGLPEGSAEPIMTVATADDRFKRAHRFLTLSVVIFAATVFEFNLTNITVALPHMQGSFSASQDQIAWVVTSFVLGMTTGLAWSGWCAERFGRKPYFMFSLIGYTIATAFCGAAAGLVEEAGWRFLQGAIGAALIPLAQATVLDSFPRHQHGMANAIFGVGIMFGPIAGPVVGGFVVEFYDWSWVFYSILPFNVVAIVAAWFLLPASSRDAGRHLDWFGFTTFILAVGALQLLLNRGQRQDWFSSSEIVVEAGVAGLCLYLFVAHSLTTRRPFIELALFRDRNVVVGFVLGFVWSFLLHGPLVLLALMMQQLQGYPVMTLGLVLAPRGVGVMVGMFLAGQLVKFVDPRHLMAFGLSCLALSSWAMSRWTIDVGSLAIVWTGMLQGFSSGCTFVPLSAKTFSTLDRRYRTEGLTLFMLVLFTGIGAGIAVAVNVMTRSTTVLHAALVEQVTPYNELFRYLSTPQAWDPASLSGLAALQREISRQAAMIGYLNYFHLITLLALAAIPLLFLFSKGRLTAETLPYDD